MAHSRFELIGRGVYTLQEASRLSGIPVARIRRWTRGYTYTVRGQRRESGPVIGLEVGDLGEVPVLTFADLIEVRFLDAFIAKGVSWRTIRIAADRAREILSLPHPFSSHSFRTDGRNILARLTDENGDVKLLDLAKNQVAIADVLEHTLSYGIEWENEEVGRWWPLHGRRTVVIDPARSFGAPILASKGVPTSVVAEMRIAEGSTDAVAEWFGVTAEEVRDAVEFETRLAA